MKLGRWFRKIDDPILLESVGLRRLPNIVNEKEVEERGREKYDLSVRFFEFVMF
ncbi:MAG: hypothetical protein JRD93_20760 [Deltaproteobacteria bacterium]|jgi:hypothetical protein|nr:hypothetical protein [Deltaproteobacteria bacterium]